MGEKELLNATEKDVETLVDSVIDKPKKKKGKTEGFKPVYILWRKDEQGNIQCANRGFNKLEIIGLMTIYLQKLLFQVHKNGFMEPEPEDDIESTGFSGDLIRDIIKKGKTDAKNAPSSKE